MPTTISATHVPLSNLEALAVRACTEAEQSVVALRAALAHAVTAGQALNEAKALVPHGGWQEWLADNFPRGERTAQLYMRFARRAAELTQRDDFDFLTIRRAAQLLAAPQDTVGLSPPAQEAIATGELKATAKAVRRLQKLPREQRAAVEAAALEAGSLDQSLPPAAPPPQQTREAALVELLKRLARWHDLVQACHGRYCRPASRDGRADVYAAVKQLRAALVKLPAWSGVTLPDNEEWARFD